MSETFQTRGRGRLEDMIQELERQAATKVDFVAPATLLSINLNRDLGEGASTSCVKHDELAAKYGNFQKRNRDLFVARWLSGPTAAVNRDTVKHLFPTLYIPTTSGEGTPRREPENAHA